MPHFSAADLMLLVTMSLMVARWWKHWSSVSFPMATRMALCTKPEVYEAATGVWASGSSGSNQLPYHMGKNLNELSEPRN